MTSFDFAKNIERAWQDVTPSDLEMGRAAYPTYHHTLKGLADHYGAGFVQTVEAFVALSPNNDYHGNLRSLVSVMDAQFRSIPFTRVTISTYRACGLRAWSYLTGDVSFLDTVKGRKITSFRDNILYLDQSRKVTVDGHMIALACGKDMTMSEANLALRQRGLYDATEGAVIRLARRHGTSPCAAQAALWTMRKRSRGIKIDLQLSLFEDGTKWDRVLPPDVLKPYPHKKG